MNVTIYLGEDENGYQRTQDTDTLPRVGDHIQWRHLTGFWRVTAVVHQFAGAHLPGYYVYTKHMRKIRHEK